MSNNESENKFITKGYLEQYNKSLCEEITNVVNSIILNSHQGAGKCEYIDQNNENLLTMHFRPSDQETPISILQAQPSGSSNTITLLGNTNIGTISSNKNLAVYGATTLMNVNFQNTPTISGTVNVNSELKLGTAGKISTKSDDSAYIQNGVINSFELQNCTSEDTSFEFIISGVIRANNQVTLNGSVTFDDIMREYQNKQLMLNVSKGTLKYVSSNYIYKDDGWEFVGNVRADGGVLIFTITDSIKNASVKMIVIGKVGGNTTCYLYDYTLSNEMRIYLEMYDYNDPTSLKSITIKRDNMPGESYDASNLAAGAKSIYKMIFKYKYVPYIYITDMNIPDINIYTQDCKYFYDSNGYQYVFITYGIYDGTQYKDLTIEMPI